MDGLCVYHKCTEKDVLTWKTKGQSLAWQTDGRMN